MTASAPQPKYVQQDQPDGVPPLELTHRDCGEPVSLALRCAAGHDVAGPREVTAVPSTRPAETPGTPAG